jgi:hypothetical protein
MGNYSKSTNELNQMIEEESNRNTLETKRDLHTYLFTVLMVVTLTYVGVKIIKTRINRHCKF